MFGFEQLGPGVRGHAAMLLALMPKAMQARTPASVRPVRHGPGAARRRQGKRGP